MEKFISELRAEVKARQTALQESYERDNDSAALLRQRCLNVDPHAAIASLLADDCTLN